ncbi:MAG: hypothetical protein ACKVOJ_12480 [Sphingomonadaceae bacterium]
MIDLPPPSYQQTFEAVVNCGIPRSNIRINYEDYLQSDVVTISDLGKITDTKLRCLRTSVHPFYVLTLENEAERTRFYEFSRREDRPREKVKAVEWLRARGILDGLPMFDPEMDLKHFATALEAGCKVAQGSALAISGPKALAFRAGLFRENVEANNDIALCLTMMFAASEATESDVRLVIVGNEASSRRDDSE